MQIGLIGAGNMARALARGWGEPVLCSDHGSGRAAELAAELGGEALSNVEVAERADLVVLCHKPAQLGTVAAEIAGAVRPSRRCSARRTVAMLQDAYPGHARVPPDAEHAGRGSPGRDLLRAGRRTSIRELEARVIERCSSCSAP